MQNSLPAAVVACRLALDLATGEEFLKTISAGGLRELRPELSREGLYGLALHLSLQDGGETKGTIQREFQGEFARSARSRHQLNEIDAILFRAGVEVVALKGACFQDSLYPTLGTRPLSDLDLWVQAVDLTLVGALLSSLSYFPHPHGLNWARPNGSVDLHVHPLNQWAPVFPAANQWWKSRQRLGNLRAVRRLAPEECLLATALHGLKHAFHRLIWLLDVALLWRKADLSRTYDLARQIGADNLLDLTAAILDEVLMGKATQPLRGNLWERQLYQRLIRRDAPQVAGMLLPLAARAPKLRKLRYLLKLAWPRGVFDAPRYLRLTDIARQLCHLLVPAKGRR